MDPEAIVRALAAQLPPQDHGIGICAFCGDDLNEAHDSRCLWRLAREWVAEHPEGETA